MGKSAEGGTERLAPAVRVTIRVVSEEPRAVFMFSEDPLPDVFTSLAAAAGDMEAVDVEEGVYHALFTLDGRVVRFGTADGRVLLEVTDERDPDDLRRRLREWCERGHLESDPDDLEAVANELLRREWEARWPKRPWWLSNLIHGVRPPQV